MSDTRADAEDFLSLQRDVLELSELELQRRWVSQPARSRHAFGLGQQADQTVMGNDAEPFRGVALLNPTPMTINVGFNAGSSIGSSLFCPPYSMLVWPAQFVNVSLGVNASDAASTEGEVTLLRLQQPPTAPAVYPYRDVITPPKIQVKPEGSTLESNQPGKLLHILGFNFDLQTSAQVGERFVGYEIADPAARTLIEVLTPALSKTNKLYGVCGFIGAPHDQTETSRTLILPLSDLYLPAGFKCNLISPFVQTEDAFPIFRWTFEFVSTTGAR